MAIPYFAHSANGAEKWHPLAEHLQCVSRIAANFAAKTEWGDEAALAGMLHDLGKYADRFQLSKLADGFPHNASKQALISIFL